MADQHKARERQLEKTSSGLNAKSAACDTLDKQLDETKQHETGLTAQLKEKQAQRF